MIKAEIKIFDLTKVFRQSGEEDGMILSRIRSGTETERDLEIINRNVVAEPPPNSIILTPYLDSAQRANDKALGEMEGNEYRLEAMSKGCYTKWTEKRLPYPSLLRLKFGCRVIIKKNEKKKIKGQYQQVFNGNQGVFKGFSNADLIIELDNGRVVYIGKSKENYGTKIQKSQVCVNPDDDPEDWRMEDREDFVPDKSNVYEQYPIRLGFAITINASQGMTLDRVYFDLDERPLWKDAYGLLYVAFSRVTSLDELYLSAPIGHMDNRVSPSLEQIEPEQLELDVSEEEDVPY